MCALARDEVTVGVTEANMNKSESLSMYKMLTELHAILFQLVTEKVLRELIEPTADRVNSVQQFLTEIKAGLKLNVVPIADLYGPSIEIADLGCLVASDETEKGVRMINEKRKELVRPSTIANHLHYFWNFNV